MVFSRGGFRAPRPPRVRGPVFAVGRRLYVARDAGDRSTPVRLTDDGGQSRVGTLIDGTEVAIVAWRPGSANDTRYRVRATESGLEGWLPAINLRSTRVAVAPPRMAPRGTDEGGR
jgi:hypothetical protein